MHVVEASHSFSLCAMLSAVLVLTIGLGSFFSSGHGMDFAAVSADGDPVLEKPIVRRQEHSPGVLLLQSNLSGPTEGEVVAKSVGNAIGSFSGVNMIRSGGKEAEVQNIVELADRDKNMAAAVSNGLFRTLATVTVIFYLVKCEKVALRIGTWKVLNGCLSLLITVLLFMAKKKAWMTVMPSINAEDSDILVLADVFNFVSFLGFAVFLVSLMKRFDGQLLKLTFVRTLGAHIIGFWGCDAFTVILKQHAFSRNASYCLLGVFVIILILELVFCLTAMLRSQADVSFQAERERSSESYLKASERMEVEISGFVGGFLLSIWVRFALIGNMPGSQYGRSITQGDLNHLRIVVLIHLLTWLAMEKFLQPRFNAPEAGAVTRKVVGKLTETIAMASSWLIFYSLQWDFYASNASVGSGSQGLVIELAAANSLAVTSSFVVFFAMFLLAVAGPGGACALVSSRFVNWAVLLGGLSWEAAAYMVVQGACGNLEQTQKQLMSFVMICCIVVALVPAWLTYVLPASLEEFDPLAAFPGSESQILQHKKEQVRKPEMVAIHSNLLCSR